MVLRKNKQMPRRERVFLAKGMPVFCCIFFSNLKRVMMEKYRKNLVSEAVVCYFKK